VLSGKRVAEERGKEDEEDEEEEGEADMAAKRTSEQQ
jgi:hypothetical protein